MAKFLSTLYFNRKYWTYRDSFNKKGYTFESHQQQFHCVISSNFTCLQWRHYIWFTQSNMLLELVVRGRHVGPFPLSEHLLLWAVHLFITKLSTLSNPDKIFLRFCYSGIQYVQSPRFLFLDLKYKMWGCKLSFLIYDNLSWFRGLMAIIISVKSSLLHVLEQSRNTNWQVTADEL